VNPKNDSGQPENALAKRAADLPLTFGWARHRVGVD